MTCQSQNAYRQQFACWQTSYKTSDLSSAHSLNEKSAKFDGTSDLTKLDDRRKQRNATFNDQLVGRRQTTWQLRARNRQDNKRHKNVVALRWIKSRTAQRTLR